MRPAPMTLVALMLGSLAGVTQGAPPAAPAQQDAVLALVERLATQVDALTGKVEALETRLRDA